MSPRAAYKIFIRSVFGGNPGRSYAWRYDVEFQGEKILTRVREPLFPACRVLQARGLSGIVEMWREGKTFADMRVDIHRGAGLTVDDGEHGPKFGKFRPRPELDRL